MTTVCSEIMSVKDLFLIPELDCASTKMIADYYEVDIHTVTICYNRNQSEIDSDGVVHKKYSEMEKSLRSNNIPIKICHGKLEAQLSDTVTLSIPHTGLKLFSKRAVLRFGMLLRDSKIAKEDVMAWMIEKQMSKRNLSDKQKDYLQGKEYELNKIIDARNKEGKNQYNSSEVSGHNDHKPNDYNTSAKTAKRIAKQYNVGEKTVRRNAEFS